MSNKNNSPEQKVAWKANQRIGHANLKRHPQPRTRRHVQKTDTFANRTLRKLAMSLLGQMGRGRKKTMTPAAIKARQMNGLKPKRK